MRSAPRTTFAIPRLDPLHEHLEMLRVGHREPSRGTVFLTQLMLPLGRLEAALVKRPHHRARVEQLALHEAHARRPHGFDRLAEARRCTIF